MDKKGDTTQKTEHERNGRNDTTTPSDRDCSAILGGVFEGVEFPDVLGGMQLSAVNGITLFCKADILTHSAVYKLNIS